MRITREQSKNGTFVVANDFVTEIMPLLSGNAVKLYLYIVCKAGDGVGFVESAAISDTRISREDFTSTMNELCEFGLVAYEEGKFIELCANENIREGKNIAIKRRLEKNLESVDNRQEFNNMLKTISNEFFAGRMSNMWKGNIEKYYSQYGFEPETIYLLFSESVSKKLPTESGFTSYVESVAKNWFENKIVTPGDVANYQDEWQKKSGFVAFVVKELGLKRNLTKAEALKVASWRDLQVTEEMISEFLSDTSRQKGFSISIIEAEIAEWQANGITTAEGVREYEAKKAEERRKAKQTSGASKQPSAKTKPSEGTQVHFESERKYSDEDLAKLLNKDSGDKK